MSLKRKNRMNLSEILRYLVFNILIIDSILINYRLLKYVKYFILI